jgi:hypothetical protein
VTGLSYWSSQADGRLPQAQRGRRRVCHYFPVGRKDRFKPNRQWHPPPSPGVRVHGDLMRRVLHEPTVTTAHERAVVVQLATSCFEHRALDRRGRVVHRLDVADAKEAAREPLPRRECLVLEIRRRLGASDVADGAGDTGRLPGFPWGSLRSGFFRAVIGAPSVIRFTLAPCRR